MYAVCTIKLLLGKEEYSITDDGESLRILHSRHPTEESWLQQLKTKMWLLDEYHPCQNEVE
jgi:hypothetical protein